MLMLQPYGMTNDNSKETYSYFFQVLPSKHILAHELLWTMTQI